MKMIKVTGWSKDQNIEFPNIELPAQRIVCPVCDGEGMTVDPAIDGNGLTQEDFDQDPDFAESYMSGTYDICCAHCNGNKVVDIVDEETCKTKLSWWKGLLRFRVTEQMRSQRFWEDEGERWMGA
jgi:hypothetical protein